MAETLSTAAQVVKVRTRRGILTIGPHGRLSGLWRIVQRELRTNVQVRTMCAGVVRRGGRQSTRPIERSTLKAWQAREGFPAPVLTLKVRSGPVEFWSRSEVEDWLAARDG